MTRKKLRFMNLGENELTRDEMKELVAGMSSCGSTNCVICYHDTFTYQRCVEFDMSDPIDHCNQEENPFSANWSICSYCCED